MKIEKTDAIGNSCNMCNSGKLVKNNHRLRMVYPYDEVLQLSGPYVKINVCSACINKIIEFIGNEK